VSTAARFPGRALIALLLLALVPASAGAFTIKGRVVNGTTQDRNLSADVIIVDPAGGMAGEQTVRAENGTFEASGLNDATTVFLVRVEYQGVMYNEMVRTSEGDPAEIVIMIYESTEAWEGVRVVMPHVVARRHGDHVEMEQLYEINNVSNPPRTIVGEGPFHFPIPEDNQAIEGVYVTALGMPIERAAEPTDNPGLYRVTYALRPGITRVGVSYRLPYDEGEYTLRQEFPYDLEGVTVYGEDPEMSITSETTTFERDTSGHDMVAYVSGSVSAGTPVAIRFAGGSGQSMVGEGGGGTASRGAVMILPNHMEEASLMIMMILLLALTAFMGITLHGTRDPLQDPDNLRSYYNTLLRRMARLDDMLEAQAVPADVHRSKREELKTQLGSLMHRIRAAEAAGVTPGAAGTGSDASASTETHTDTESASAP
jgi:hypothetical protein